MSEDSSGTGRIRRVALVVDRLAPGGKERVVTTLAQEFQKLHVATTVICLHSRGKLADELSAAGVMVETIHSKRSRDVGAIGRLAAVLQDIQPDVINVHDRSSLPYVAAARDRVSSAPLVLSCHGLLLESGQASPSRTIAAGNLATLTAVAPHVAEHYVASLRATAPVVVIPNGVDFPDANVAAREGVRESLGISPKEFMFLAVGTIKREKGYPDLLAACELLHKEGRAFRLIVAGGMDDEVYWRVVQHAVSNDHLERFVTFLGHRDDTSDLLAAADAYVLPSRSEGLPLALLEAASAGLPIVATDVGDVGNVLDGDAGLLVEPGDPDALAAGMDRLLDDPKLREQLGRTASLRVRRNFGADTMAARYLELYERVAAGRRKDGRRGVIVVGPQTPTTGGMSAVVSGIWRTMTERGRQTAILNSGKTTPTDRGLATGVAAQLRLLWRVIRGIRRTRAKIVHIHTCSGWVFWRDVALATVAGLVNRRVVWHVHGGRFAEFAAGCGRPGRSIMRWAFESASAVIALSDGWRDRLRSIAPRAKWRVVPNGVPVESEMLPSSERFLFLGNLGPDKGAAELIAAAAAAKRQGCELHIDLAGAETAAGQRDSLVRAIAGGGLQHHVRLIGVVTGLAKHRALAGAGCLVQPSAVEAMPLSVLEAMAAGRAVIATDVGAVGEMIDNETEGLVIPPGDVAALAGAMTRLAGDADLRNRMGVAAWRRARRCYSEQVMADALAAVYDEVVN